MTSEKFKAQAWICKLREMERVQKLGSAQENCPKASQTMTRFIQAQQATLSQDNQSQEGNPSYEVPSQIAFDGHRLNDQDQDCVYLDLSKYLLDETLFSLSKDCLEYVNDKQTFDYLANTARYNLMSRQYNDAISSYQTLQELDAKWLPGYIECGHANIMLK